VLIRAIRKVVRSWRRRRDPVAFARSIGVRVGNGCRFLDTTDATFGSEPYLVKIGDHVTVTSGVTFITHDGGVWVFRDADPNVDLIAPVVVGNNVFIGIGTIVMPGVSIGDNSVIGAGSVVTRSIPANTVAVGVPAKPVKTIADYRAKVAGAAMSIRGLTDDEKRRVLLARFSETLR
jgi:acetyltransferase-like isoleucine patch superfamily enzyme